VGPTAGLQSRREKFLAPTGFQTPDRQAHSPVLATNMDKTSGDHPLQFGIKVQASENFCHHHHNSSRIACERVSGCEGSSGDLRWCHVEMRIFVGNAESMKSFRRPRHRSKGGIKLDLAGRGCLTENGKCLRDFVNTVMNPRVL
jgi:hypothetical protein